MTTGTNCAHSAATAAVGIIPVVVETEMVRLHSLTATATTDVHGCCTSDGCATVQQEPVLHGIQPGRAKRRRWIFFMLGPISTGRLAAPTEIRFLEVKNEREIKICINC